MSRNEPLFPLYIVSKGRADTRLTSKALEAMGVPYWIVVEEAERAVYEAVIGPLGKVLILDPEYQRTYDAFSDLGAVQSKGSGPARNFAWEHSIATNGRASWHWCMDDNIKSFVRFNRNMRLPIGDGTFFRCMEDFALRYANVAMAGPNYATFIPRKYRFPPFVLNTRVYSCNLIRNDIPFRWRGRYNEDTDLSLRILKAGWCTIQFNAFLQNKTPTLAMKGGNTEVLYGNGQHKRAKSQMLVDMHPDVARIIVKYGRWHHYVNYKPFRRNKLLLRKEIEIGSGVDEYGMALEPIAKAQRKAVGPKTKKAGRSPASSPAPSVGAS